MNEDFTACYTAIDGADSVWLKIDTSQRKIAGLIKFNYGNKDVYEGEIEGEFKGDTLKGYFDFKRNGVDKWYRNPISLLREGQKLTMGGGKVILVWGSGHFDEKVPIDYNRAKFVFSLDGCKINTESK
ncbi:MAG: hypothetical protein EOO90_20370 [Pedobacter sp.]|nr:MAG: hypothetical protein EOO90_20370 [Pedobacter sp.]